MGNQQRSLLKKYHKNKMYSVTEGGDIYSHHSNRYLKRSLSATGYSVVNICVDGKRSPQYIHRMVAETYLNNDEGYPVVNHKDGDKGNNHVSNLEWCTEKENTLHALNTGLLCVADDHPNARTEDAVIHQICKYFQDGLTTGEVLMRIQDPTLNRSKLLKIRSRASWRSISKNYIWEDYPNKRNKLAKTFRD